MDIADIMFDEQGLVPVTVQDYNTREVLTLAYMNRESLAISLQEGRTCFWSRSRRELWRKGETSGNVQRLVTLRADCDGDALLAEVIPEGPTCHTGETSCFHQEVFRDEAVSRFSAEDLYRLILGRKTEGREGSYTTYLFEKGEDKILKKVGEECTEVIIAAKNGDRKELVFEIADLMYHVLVLMAEKGVSVGEIRRELAGRHVVDKKVKQEKMQ